MRRPFSSATVASRRRCGGNQLEITMRRRALQEFAPKAAARKNSLCRVGLYCQGCCRVMMMGVQSLTALAAVGELLYKIWSICASQPAASEKGNLAREVRKNLCSCMPECVFIVITGGQHQYTFIMCPECMVFVCVCPHTFTHCEFVRAE
jgi:hypothetical protein